MQIGHLVRATSYVTCLGLALLIGASGSCDSHPRSPGPVLVPPPPSLAAPLTRAPSAPIPGATGEGKTGFRAVVFPSVNPRHEAWREGWERGAERRFWEKLAKVLNQIFKLPRVVEIQVKNCPTPNLYFDPNTKTVVICYEFFDYLFELFDGVPQADFAGIDAWRKVLGTIFFAFYHELGHALIDVLEIPVLGKEEDAADQLAAYLTLLAIKDLQGLSWVALSAADWFKLQGALNKRAGQPPPYWDAHSLSLQRYYHVLCLVYGSAPNKFIKLLGPSGLPQHQARRCVSEAKNVKRAWSKVLAPHMGVKLP